MTTQEKNEIIAKWMGYQSFEEKGIVKWLIIDPVKKIYSTPSKDLHYDSSWDDLMPVVEKINRLFDEGAFQGFDTDVYRSMQDWILSVNIQNAHSDLVSMIQWHNNQKG